MDTIYQELAEKYVAELTTAQVADWLGQQGWSEFAQSLAAYHIRKGYLTEKQEAAGRSMMIKCTVREFKKAADRKAAGEVPTGMHKRADGTVVKVYTTQAGNLVGKVLVDRLGIGGVEYEFEYRGKRALNGLSGETLMSIEDARKFGRLTSQCVNCLKQLKDERSIAAGYGATCADNHGWWYPTMAQAMEIIAAEGLAALV